jgi:hypothetical protein
MICPNREHSLEKAMPSDRNLCLRLYPSNGLAVDRDSPNRCFLPSSPRKNCTSTPFFWEGLEKAIFAGMKPKS